MRLTLRDVRPWGGRACDVAIDGGRIVAVGARLPRGGEEIDGGGDVLLPGLHDHHLHLMALAARRRSVDLAGLIDPPAIRAALGDAPGEDWVRAVNYDERADGLPDSATLDEWIAERPCRLQDRSGALWVLNGRAMQRLGDSALPVGAERDADGRPTGRFWREDAWLRTALPGALPDVAALAADFARMGLTSVTDASATNGPREAALLAGKLPQRLCVMGDETLRAGDGYALGPLKLLIDERDPPDPAALADRIRQARGQDRPVAAHCVTEAELAIYLAALNLAGGGRSGDRVEHGAMIPREMIGAVADAGLIVVTNPGFLHDRGDRYVDEIPAVAQDDLYRIASLMAAGIPMRAGSDAPYAGVDPWLGMRASQDRLTAAGARLAAGERVDGRRALGLYCSGRVEPGVAADLILCRGSLGDVLADLTAARVWLTIIAGVVAFARD